MPTCTPYEIFTLAAAWLLDAVLGDPEKLPHPVRLIGALISRLEERAPQWFKSKKAAGACIGLFVPAFSWLAAFGIIKLAAAVHAWLGFATSAIIIYYCLATRCLACEATAVLAALEAGDSALARQRLSRIVGRDTAALSEAEIVRATIETVSENTVDGIISPLFFAALGGAPLALAFKAVSTLDSMIGYKNEKYLDLGCFSARLDDVLNYLPARLCLGLVPLAALWLLPGRAGAAFRVGRRDGRKSPSPNSGFPEACFAGALGIQLGGPCSYAGVVSNKPLLGDNERELSVCDIQKAVRLMWLVSDLSLALFSGFVFLLYYI